MKYRRPPKPLLMIFLLMASGIFIGFGFRAYIQSSEVSLHTEINSTTAPKTFLASYPSTGPVTHEIALETKADGPNRVRAQATAVQADRVKVGDHAFLYAAPNQKIEDAVGEVTSIAKAKGTQTESGDSAVTVTLSVISPRLIKPESIRQAVVFSTPAQPSLPRLPYTAITRGKDGTDLLWAISYKTDRAPVLHAVPAKIVYKNAHYVTIQPEQGTSQFFILNPDAARFTDGMPAPPVHKYNYHPPAIDSAQEESKRILDIVLEQSRKSYDDAVHTTTGGQSVDPDTSDSGSCSSGSATDGPECQQWIPGFGVQQLPAPTPRDIKPSITSP